MIFYSYEDSSLSIAHDTHSPVELNVKKIKKIGVISIKISEKWWNELWSVNTVDGYGILKCSTSNDYSKSTMLIDSITWKMRYEHLNLAGFIHM